MSTKVNKWKKIPDYPDYEICKKGLIRYNKDNITYPKNLSWCNGYRIVRLSNKEGSKKFKVHVLMGIVYLGYIPNRLTIVDHKKNIKHDNRLSQLQVITQRENVTKDRQRSIGKLPGVSKLKKGNRYRSMIWIKGKRKHIGCFATAELAHEAYLEKIKELQNGKS